ncbi:unnamed protein product [Darwinula stevensoni]|uniref:Uncharacterized protein n=1 Tax=Darwinula stevensoni TaxID=69355 RepID=A0A7R8XHW7_9CRUS|nr:unnamed protein product [Darwinula stevensoni]CAG0892884.1 unnamed protein product [Darwinula stevensoni]
MNVREFFYRVMETNTTLGQKLRALSKKIKGFLPSAFRSPSPLSSLKRFSMASGEGKEDEKNLSERFKPQDPFLAKLRETLVTSEASSPSVHEAQQEEARRSQKGLAASDQGTKMNLRNVKG